MGQSKFLTPRQNFAITHRYARINLLYGSVRSGKTYVSLIMWALFVASMPENAEFLMVGKTLTTLKRNCLGLLQELEPSFRFSISGKKGILYGRTIWLEGADNERAENKIRGMTLSGAYIDELTLIPESFYMMALSRLSMKGAKLIATTNPDSPSNYVYQEIIKNQNIDKNVLKFTIDENTFLDPEYVVQLKKEYSGVFYDRFILGEFVRAEGVIYKDFADDAEPYLFDSLPDGERIHAISIGIDYGASQSHTALKASGFTNGFKNVYILAEKDIDGIHDPETLYRAFHMFYNEICKEYGRCQYVFADYGALGQVLTAGLYNYCRSHGLPVQVNDCVKGTILERIELVTSLMAQGRLKIHRSCKRMIQAFRDAVWDEKHEDERLDDGTSDIDSLDAFEYSIFSFQDKLVKRRA